MREQSAKVCEKLAAANIDWFILSPGTNLEYVSGIKRRPPTYTRVDHHGSWAEMGLLKASGELFYVAPRMIADFETVGQDNVTMKRIEEGQPVEAQLARILEAIGLRSGRVAVEDQFWSQALLWLTEALADVTFVSGAGLIEAVRRIKSPGELEQMQQAAVITDTSFAAVVEAIGPGVSEWDIATELERILRQNGAEALSFPTNVYSHSGACPGDIRHREPRHFKFGSDTTIAFDFGCVHRGYCTDFGRTVSIGEPTKIVRAYHDAIVHAQRRGIEALRPGARANEVHRAVYEGMEEAGFGQYFVHRTGHGIGMDVHEPPLLDELDDTPLEEGMVFTVEPSVIVDGGLWVRIEDIVVVGEKGGIPLTRYPRELVVV